MKANNLTICIDAHCTKNCPYCISNMTFHPKPNYNLFERNIDKAVEVARLASVTSVLISSKGEPLNNLDMVKFCCKYFKTFPLEIQTNGESLNNPGLITTLYNNGINTVAISIDKYQDIQKYKDLYKSITQLGMNIRLTILLSDLFVPETGYNLLTECNQYGIKQLTIRLITIPNNYNYNEQSLNIIKWIKSNVNYEKHTNFMNDLRSYQNDDNLIRKLCFGPSVYDMEGIAVTTMSYCIQESNNIEDIRSLIYHQDGHMYTSWDKTASLIF